MIKIIIIFSVLVINTFANALLNTSKIASFSHEAVFTKQLINITQKDLVVFPKSENIQNLFEVALNENRLTYDQFKYISTYNNLEKGDLLLLKCLKEKACNIDKFANIMERSELHQKIAYKFPQVSVGKLNQIVGTINENLMNKYFISSGWTKIEGEVGRNGIDGLFIKRNKDGIIKDILIVESKYNKSGLQNTEHGQQMTKQWILKKIQDLQKKYSENNDYIQIEKFVNNDIYRAMLWNLKVENENLIFDLNKLNDKNGKIDKINLLGGEKLKIIQMNNSYIDINNPSNDFQKKIIDWYNQELNSIKL